MRADLADAAMFFTANGQAFRHAASWFLQMTCPPRAPDRHQAVPGGRGDDHGIDVLLLEHLAVSDGLAVAL